MGCRSEEPDIIKTLRKEEKSGKFKKFLNKTNDSEILTIENNFEKNLDKSLNSELFKNIIETSPDGIVYVNNLGIIKYSNQSGAKLIGYSNKNEIIGKHFSKIGAFKPSQIPKYFKIFSSILNGNNPGLMEIEYQRKDGTTFSAEVKVELLLNENNKKIGILAISRNITDRKNFEQSITQSKINLQNLYNSIADPVVIVDSKGKFLDMNQNVTKYTDYTRDELIGKNFLKTKIVTKKSKIKLLTNLTKRMAGFEIKPYVIEILRKNGDRLPFEVNAQKIEYFGKSADIVVFRDISQRIKAEKALKSSEIRYRTLFENSDDGIFIVKLDGNTKFIDCNPQALKIFNCKKEDIIGKTSLDFSPEYQTESIKSKDYSIEKINNAIKGIDNNTFEWIYKTKDGKKFNAEVTLAYIELEGEKFLQAIIRDITDRKKAEITLKESEEKYRALFYNNVDLLFMHDLKDNKPSNFIEINDKFCNLLGYQKEELLKMNMKDLVEENFRKELDDNIINLLKGEDILFETTIIGENKEKIPLEIHKSIIKINGKPVVLGIAREIAERKKSEEELQKLASVVRHSGELVNLATLDGQMIFLNQAGEKMLGIHTNQVKTHTIYDVIPNDLQFIVKKQVIPSILNKGFWQGELRYKNIETGTETFVYAFTFVIEDPETNKPLYLANVSRDITEQKRDERKLEKAHNELKELNEQLENKVKNRTKQIQNLLKQKDEFINQLGHDLKNPLGPLVNLLPIVEKEEKDPKIKEILQVINRNVDYMRNLVIKTIQLARLNSPKTEFNFEELNLFDIINSVIKNNELLLKNRDIKLKTNIDKDIITSIDKLRFEELINNLINNSVKYSKESGKIIIDTIYNEDFITISIKDNGIGMSKNQIQNMFDEFYKADDARHDFDSSGLGLTISKKIVEKHGGKIWAESEGLGKGSTFYFTLPKKIQK